jgi:phosphate-selective porin OprO/OprP
MKITTKKLTTLTSLFLLISNSAIAAQNVSQTSLQQQLNELQKQINLLERKQEVVEEISKSNADKYATVSFDNKGLVIDSPDHKYSFKLKGYIQADSRNYVDRKNREVDQFLIRSARPVFEAKFPQGFSTRLMLDFGNNQARLIDAFGDWKLNDKFTLRLGKFKTAVGLERWQGETEILFVERGLTTNLVPFRDIGIAASGEIIPQTLEYQLSLTDGVSDNADGNGDTGNGKDLTARVFTQPFKNTDLINLQNFGIGLAGSFGQKTATPLILS